MRLIQISDSLPDTFYADGDAVYGRLIAAQMCLVGNTIEFHGYGSELWETLAYPYEGKNYFLRFENKGERHLLQSYLKGETRLVDEDCVPINLPPEAQYLLVGNLHSREKNKRFRNGYIFGSARFANWEKRALLVNCKTAEARSLDTKFARKPVLLDDCLLLMEGMGELSCRDLDFALRWTFRPEVEAPIFTDAFVQGPEVHDGLVFITFGHTRSENIIDPHVDADWREYPEDSFHDAVLYALDLTNGQVRWQAVIPKSIDNMRVHGGRLYICSADEMHVLDNRTGEQVRLVTTGLSADYNRLGHNKSFLEIVGNYLYFCHAVDACVLVYAIDSLEFIRRLDIPAPYSLASLLYAQEADGKAYFNCQWHRRPDYGHMRPILEIDPAKLHDELTIYTGPPATTELKPSDTKQGETELWIEIQATSLDEALVFAEYHAENLAFYHGVNTFQLVHSGRADIAEDEPQHITRNFNGIIHIRFSACGSPQETIDAKLKVLTRRFDQWVRDKHIYSCLTFQHPVLDIRVI